MRFPLLFLLFFLGTMILSAQNKETEDRTNLSLIDSTLWATFGQGDYPKALILAKKSVAFAEEKFGTTDTAYANSMYGLGLLHNQLGQFKEAEEVFLETKDLQAKAYGQEHVWYLSTEVTLANIYTSTGRYKDAAASYKRVIPVLKRVFGVRFDTYNQALFSQAALYFYMGEYEKSETPYLEVVKNWGAVYGKKHYNYATVTNSLASLYMKMGRYKEAEPLVLEAKSVYAEVLGTEHAYYGGTLHNLGSIYTRLKKYKEAELLFLENKEILAKTVGKKHPTYLKGMNNLANIYKQSGALLKAEAIYIEIKDIIAENQGTVTVEYALVINSLGLLYQNMGRFEAAVDQHEAVLTTYAAASGKETPKYALTMAYLAEAKAALGNFEAAVDLCQKALVILESTLTKANPSYLETLNRLAKIKRRQGKYEESMQLCLEGLAINIEWKGKELLLNEALYKGLPTWDYISEYEALSSLRILHDILKIKAEFEVALELNKASILLLDRIKNDFSESENKLTLLAGSLNFIEWGIELSMELGADRFEYAWHLAEKNKSIVLDNALKAQRARAFGDLPDSLALEEKRLQQKKDQLKKLFSEARTDSLKNNATVQLNQINDEIADFQTILKSDYPKYNALKFKDNMSSLKELQTVLEENTLFLEYFISDSMVYVFAIDQKEIRVHPYEVQRSIILQNVGELREALSDYDAIIKSPEESYSRYSHAAFWCYQNLLAPLLKDKDYQRLIIVADGALGHIPFEAFLTEDLAGEKRGLYKDLPYLLNKYTLSYDYSATLWYENTQKQTAKNNNQILAYAASYNMKSDSSARRTVRAPHLRNLRDVLTELPAVKDEVEGLSKILKGKFLYNVQANEHSFKRIAQEYGIIHLAMHGILDTEFPILSSLAFTEDGDSLEDNFLQAYEISHLKLNASLVVLSACETGYGKFQQGEGVMSLARSFMYAGVPSMVVSLWQVNDASTALIMQDFYKNLAKGMDKAEALCKAKLSYLRRADNIAAHPAFWAPFIQLGDSRPISIQAQNSGLLVWWIGGGVLVLLGIGGFVMRRRKKEL